MNGMQMTTVAWREAGRRRRARLVAVAATVAAALGLWALLRLVLGVDLRSPASFGRENSTLAVGPGNVALVSAVAGFAAWGVLAGLERLIPRAGRVWMLIAVLALMASLGGPMAGTGITIANRMELMEFHLMVLPC